MIRINGFFHREKLYDLARRWMLDQPQPDDAGTILYFVHFNNLVVSRYLSDFSGQLFSALHQCDLSMEKACIKGDLKDQIIAHPLHRTPASGNYLPPIPATRGTITATPASMEAFISAKEAAARFILDQSYKTYPASDREVGTTTG